MSKDKESKKEDEQEPGQEKKKICFVMMPFSEIAGYEPEHFPIVYKHK